MTDLYKHKYQTQKRRNIKKFSCSISYVLLKKYERHIAFYRKLITYKEVIKEYKLLMKQEDTVR